MSHRRFRTLIVSAAFLLSLAAWPFLPGSLPESWGLGPAAAAWVSRSLAAFLLPIAAAMVSRILGGLPATNPRTGSDGSFRATFDLAVDAGIVLILGTHATLLAVLLAGPRAWLGYVLPLLVGAVALVVGNALPRLRPNAAIGIRTPWTTRDAQVWATSHRAGGYVLVAYGVAVLVVTFTARPWIGLLVGPGAGVLVLLLALVSYFAWRADASGRQMTRTP